MHILKVLIVTTAIFSSGLSLAQTKIIVTHPEVQAPTFLDHGKPGQSIGDVRLWHFPAKANDGTNITTDWIMTTTGVVSDKGVEYRITSAVFLLMTALKIKSSSRGLQNIRALKRP